jgi:hypothetical protein
MPEINICNEAGRDAAVTMESVFKPLRVRWIDEKGRQAQSVRILKSTLDRDIGSLSESHGKLEEVSSALISSDPEVDMEIVGTILNNTSRVYVNPKRQIVHRIEQFEIIKNPDGSEREKRSRELTVKNVSEQTPLKWSGVFIKRDEAMRKFLFSNKLQLFHINGLTYDFLFGICKELEEKDSLMLLGAGPKGNQPLILRRGSVPYRGFLEGRTDGDKYCLLLHLSNLELKPPEETEES